MNNATVKLIVIVDKDIPGATLEETATAAKKMKVTDFITFKQGVGHSDSEQPKVVSVSTGEWLD